MIILNLFKGLYNKLIKYVEGIIYRAEKRGDNLRGHVLGGPKRMRRIAIAFVSLIAVVSIVAVYVRDGGLLSIEGRLEREVSTGAKKTTAYRPNIEGRDVGGISRLGVGMQVDCEDLMRNLRTRGFLTLAEKTDFDSECRDKVGDSIARLVDRVVSGEIPRSVVQEIFSNITPAGAEKIEKLLDNKAILDGLRSDSGIAIARALEGLSDLDEDEISDVIETVRQAPPQYKDAVLDAAVKLSQIEEPGARKALLTELKKARSPEQIRQLTDFADVIADMSTDEQNAFTEALVNTKTPDGREKLIQAARQIKKIDKDDPVRARLVEAVQEASKLDEDGQKKMYDRLGKVAQVYAETDDPALKRAMAKELTEFQNDLTGLAKAADRIIDVAAASETGLLDKETALDIIAGVNDGEYKKIKTVADLVRAGNMDLAKDVMTGKASLAEADQYLAQTGRKIDSTVSANDLKILANKKIELQKESAAIQAEIDSLLAAGVSPDDPRIKELYRRMLINDQAVEELTNLIAEGRRQLQDRLSNLRRKLGEEFGAAGFRLPEFDIDLPSFSEDNGAPPPRLSNLRDVPEFWEPGAIDDAQAPGGRKKVKSLRFTTNADANQPLSRSIFDEMIEDAGPGGVAYNNLYGGAAQGGVAATKEFEISRLQRVPGVVRRIPAEGISSNDVGRTIIEFEFLADVASRKTGKIEIPRGSIAICKAKSFDADTGRLSATCDKVDTGASEDLAVNFTLADGAGTDGLPGRVTDSRGWYLAGVFMTAFSQAIIDAFTEVSLGPIQSRAAQSAADILVLGAGTGTRDILQEVATKQIEDWQKAAVFWHGYDGQIATLRQF